MDKTDPAYRAANVAGYAAYAAGRAAYATKWTDVNVTAAWAARSAAIAADLAKEKNESKRTT